MNSAARVELEPAFVLHTRPYTDSRILAELFTPEHGRVSAVARTSGASTASGKRAARFASLRPFQPLLVSWQGRSDLKTLSHSESAGPTAALAGKGLYCGMYLNELLLRVTAVGDPQPLLFPLYQNALLALAEGQPMEPVLRNFELDLLAELGYGVAFDTDMNTAQPLAPQSQYSYDPYGGFVLATDTSRHSFSGAVIRAVGARDFTRSDVQQAAKYICRNALQPLLGNKPLKSRELFR